MLSWILVALGGAAGALLRWGLGSALARSGGEGFPWGTLGVNLLGCLLIGLLWVLTERQWLSPRLAPLIFTGLLGAFTTFSTFSLDALLLVRAGEWTRAAAYVLISNLGGLLLAWGGYWLGSLLTKTG